MIRDWKKIAIMAWSVAGLLGNVPLVRGEESTPPGTNPDLPVVHASETDSPPSASPAESDKSSQETQASGLPASPSAQRHKRDQLWKEAQSRRSSGKLVEAAELGEQVLALETTWRGSDHADVMTSHEWLATLYETANRFSSALPHRQALLAWHSTQTEKPAWHLQRAQRAMVELEQLQGLTPTQITRLEESRALLLQADTHYQAKAYAEAAPLYAQVLAMRTELLGSNHSYTAIALRGVAYTHFFLKQYDQALDQCQKAVASFEAAAMLFDAAWVHAWIGDIQSSLNHNAEALQAYSTCIQRHMDLRTNANLGYCYYERARIYQRQKDFAHALDDYRTAAENYKKTSNPARTAYAYIGLAACQRDLRQYEAAVNSFTEAIQRLEPLNLTTDHADALDMRARVLYNLKRYQQALADFHATSKLREIQKRTDLAGIAYAWMGDCHRDMRQDEQAIVQYEQAAQHLQGADNPGELGYVLDQKSRAGYRLGRFDAAREGLAQARQAYALANRPIDVGRTNAWIGHCFRDQNQTELALEAYTEALKTIPEDQLPDEVAYIVEQRARQRHRNKQYAEALADFTAARALYEKLKRPAQIAHMFSWVASCHRFLNQFDAAFPAMDECLRIRHEQGLVTDTADAYLQRGELHLIRKQFDSALADFQSAIKSYEAAQAPKSAAWIYDWIGDCYVAMKQDKPAVDAFTECVSRHASAQTQENVGNTLLKRGLARTRLSDHELAITDFQQAQPYLVQAKRMADVAWSHALIAECHRKLDRKEAALEAYTASIDAYTQNTTNVDFGNVLYDRGRLLIALKRYDEAISDLQAARTQFERFQRVRDAGVADHWIGMAHAEQSQHDAAIAAFCRAEERLKTLPASLDLMLAVYQRGRSHYQARLYPLALADFQQASTLAEQIGQASDAAWLHDWLGDCYARLGRDEEALAAFLQCHTKLQQLPTPLDGAAALDKAGQAAFRLRRYEEATKHFLACQTAHIQANRMSEAGWVYSSLAACQRESRQYDAALATLDAGLQHFQKLNLLAGVAALTADQAVVYVTQGDFATAEPLFQKALQTRLEVLGDKHADYAASLNSLGLLYDRMGDHVRAESMYRQAMEIRRAALGEMHPDYAMSLNNLALLYDRLGDYQRAEPLYRQAMQINRTALGEESATYAINLSNLAGLYYTIEDIAQAEPLQRKVLEIRRKILGENHPDYANCLLSMANIYSYMGDRPRAEEHYQQAVRIIKTALGDKHPQYAGSLVVVANYYSRIGDYAQAEPLYREALDIRRTVLGAQHNEYANVLSSLALMSHDAGDYDKALPLYREALEISLAHLEAASAALTERQQMLLTQSLRYRLDNYLSCLVHGGGEADSAYAAVLGWKGATLVRQRAARLAADTPQLAPLFQELQSVVAQWSALLQAAPDGNSEWQSQLTALTQRKERLEAELGRQNAAYPAQRKVPTISQMQSALPTDGVLVDYLEFDFAEPSASRKGELVRTRSLLAFTVPPQGPVRMVYLGPTTPVHEQVDQWRSSLGMTADAKLAAQNLRTRIWAPLETELQNAQTVLVSPDGAIGRLPLSVLPGRREGTYLLEDVKIALIPVPQLIPSWIHDAAPSASPAKDLLVMGGVDYDRRELLNQSTGEGETGPLRPWQRRSNNALAARRSMSDQEAWQFLSGSDSEASFVRDLYQEAMQLPAGTERVVALRGPRATEETFRAEAAQCALLHLATHGFFASDSDSLGSAQTSTSHRRAHLRGHSPGLLSGLVLAGANHPPELPTDAAALAKIPDDGYLTADEIAFMPLEGVQMVVLSACDSGLGETAGGEGLLGIQRAFQIAGARTTIATQWKVNDEATRRIMEEFYRNYLQRQMSPLDALRNAQLWALHNPDLVPRGADPPAESGTETEHQPLLPPQFWAPFTLSGDWR